MKQVEHEDKRRQQSLFTFEKNLHAQEEADQKRTERMMRNQIVAETALHDLKDSNETRWRELQLVHKFLNFFLKRKTEREIRQYEAVEKAYQKIKASTGLADTREIVNKFANREQTYSELLISIAEYEKRISELRKVNESLKAKAHSIKEQALPPEKLKEDKIGAKSHLLESYKDLESASEATKQSKLVMEKAYSWSLQTLIKIDKAKKIINNKHYSQYPKEKFVDAFLKVMETVNEQLSALKEKEIEQVLDEIDKTKVDEVVRNEEFITKNMRVKPLQTKTDRPRAMESPLNSRRSAHIEETVNTETEGEENNEEEQESFEPQRMQIKNKALEEIAKTKKQQEKKEKEAYSMK